MRQLLGKGHSAARTESHTKSDVENQLWLLITCNTNTYKL